MKLIKMNDAKKIPKNSQGRVTLASYQKWAVGILENIQNQSVCIALDLEGVYIYSEAPEWDEVADCWDNGDTYIRLGDVFNTTFDYGDSLVGYEVDNSTKFPKDTLIEVYNGQKWIKRYSAGKVTKNNDIYVYDLGCTSKTSNTLRAYRKSRFIEED